MQQPEHILSSFDQALERLREGVITMSSHARKNLANAMRGLLERDSDLCNQTIADDQDVNQLEKSVDKLGLDILFRFHPLAHDLRQVMGTIRIANNLERISDQASSIAKRARKVNALPELSEVNLLQPVYELAARLLETSVNAFATSDIDTAATLPTRDKELDAAEKHLQDCLLQLMESRSGSLEVYLHLIFIGRFLERVGDHAKNIAEDIIFIERAEDVRFIKDKRTQND
jgi:phosphate transport system protein